MKSQGGYRINTQDFNIHFWGVRGSCPVSSVNRMKFGTNTSCVEVRCGEERIVFDAGTGICELGNTLLEQDKATGHIFISHPHYDHIQGLPHFMPGYEEGGSFHLYGEGKRDKSFEEVIKGIMSYPYFPVAWEMMRAKFYFHQIQPREEIAIGDVRVKAIALQHPDSCLGYRVTYQGRSCCYLSDYEYQEAYKQSILDFISYSDVLICDTTFTEEEYETRKGWGHGTWERAVALAKEASVKQLVLFHHDLFRSDEELESIEREAKSRYVHTIAAREGTILTL